MDKLINELNTAINSAREAQEWEALEELEEIQSKLIKAKEANKKRAAQQAVLSESFYVELLTLLSSNQKISAIKHIRELTGWGLKEAKDFVDRIDSAGKVGKWHKDRLDANTMTFYANVANMVRFSRGVDAACYVYDHTHLSSAQAQQFVDDFTNASGL